MKHSMRVLIVALAVCGASTGAMAVEVCKRQVHTKFDEKRIYARSFIASCKPGAQCRIVTHKLDKKAPLGFSHTFAFQRDTVQSKWRILLVDVLDLANMKAGFQLTVDKNSAMNIVAEHISAPLSINEYALDAGLSDLVLKEAKPGNIIRWSYATPAGEQRKVAFSLSGLTSAMAWAECAQPLLASGKSDPPSANGTEPEYSPPEAGVPVDPVGDGRD